MRIPVRSLLLALAITTCLARPGLGADPAKKPTDFRGIRWGDAASKIPGLTVVDRDGEITHYDRPGEKKDLGGIPLQHVTYSFFKGQFYHAEIGYEGQGAYEALQHSLEQKYGPPDAVRQKTDASGHHYEVAVWSWPGYAFIGNRHDKDSPRGRIFYFYDPLTDQSAKAQGLSPKPQPGKAGTYTVQKGDSLSRLAKQFGVSADDLAKANPGLTDKTLKAGATINMPGKAASPAAGAADKAAVPTPDRTPTPLAKPAPMAAPTSSGGFIEYKVKDGDILSKVANAHGARTRDVVAANPGINPDALRPGTILRIPAGKAAATPASAPQPTTAPPAASQPADTPAPSTPAPVAP